MGMTESKADGTKSWQELLLEYIFREEVKGLPDLNKCMWIALNTLSARERQILLARFKYGMSYKEVGALAGVGAHRIRHIEFKAMLDLRHPSRSKYLKYGWQKMQERKRRGYLKVKKNKIRVGEKEIPNVKLYRLNISVKACTVLMKAKINNIGELLEYLDYRVDMKKLLRIPNLGSKRADEIATALGKYMCSHGVDLSVVHMR